MNKNILLSVELLVLLIAIPLAALAQENQVGPPGEVGTGTVGPPVEITPLGPAGQNSIDSAAQYVKQKLGENYFNQYVTFESGEKYQDCIEGICSIRNMITFIYEIPFEAFGSAPMGAPPTRIYVTLDGTDTVTGYSGTVKPYQFIVSENQAMDKARAYGLQDITGATLVSASGTADGYEIAWAVASNDLAGDCRNLGGMEECIYKGVYVDVDTGQIRGEFRINPLILTPSGTGSATLGQYFNDQNQSGSGSNTLGNSMPIIIAILGAIVAAGMIVYKVRK